LKRGVNEIAMTCVRKGAEFSVAGYQRLAGSECRVRDGIANIGTGNKRSYLSD